jgi:hypothetical protein
MGRAAVLPIGSNPEFDDSYSPCALAMILVHALHLLGDIAIHSDCCDAQSGEAHYRRALHPS